MDDDGRLRGGGTAAVSWVNTNQIHGKEEWYHFQLRGRHKSTVMRSLDSLRRPICGRIFMTGNYDQHQGVLLETSSKLGIDFCSRPDSASSDFTARNC